MGTLALAQRGRHTMYIFLAGRYKAMMFAGCLPGRGLLLPREVIAALVGSEKEVGGLYIPLLRVLVVEYHSHR